VVALVDVGGFRVDAELDRAAGPGGEAVLEASEVAGDQREEIGWLEEGVLPQGPVAAVGQLALLQQVAVGEEDRAGR
jgi:hypothetical protein